LAGPKLPNEDLYLFQKLFREVLGSNNIDHRSGAPDQPAELDDLTPALGIGAGTNLMTLGKGTSVLVIGADPEEEAPLYVLRLRGIADRGGELNVVNPFPTKLDRFATRTAHPRVGTGPQFVLALLKIIAEDRLLNADFTARLRGVPELLQQLGKLNLADLVTATGVAGESMRAIAQSFANAENGIIVYGRTAMTVGALPQALANLAMLSGKVGRPNNGLIALLPQGNTRGALDMGVRPDAGPGGAAVASPGLSAREMWGAAVEGRLRGMYIAGLNPAKSSSVIAEALAQLEFLVVQDLFFTETAQLADVVLPVAAFAEREGTFTNAERRVQRFRQARRPLGDLPPDWLIFQDLARALQAIAPAAPVAEVKKNRKARPGAVNTTDVALAAAPLVWDYVISSDIADEISANVRGYSGTTYTSLELTRKSWGRQSNEAFYYDGTSYENTEGVGVQIPTTADDGRTIFQVTFREPTAAISDERYPLVLLTPTRAYDGGEWMRGSKLLNRLAPAHAILSMPDAQRLGVGMGEKIQLKSVAGTLELAATIDAGLNEGLVLIPDAQGIQLASILTGPQTRVAVTKIAD
jgi:NADH-quinone oxidoreductase subunit G